MGRFLHSQAGEESLVSCGTSDWKTSVGSCGSVNQLFALSGVLECNWEFVQLFHVFCGIFKFSEVEDLCPKKKGRGGESKYSWTQLNTYSQYIYFEPCVQLLLG